MFNKRSKFIQVTLIGNIPCTINSEHVLFFVDNIDRRSLMVRDWAKNVSKDKDKIEPGPVTVGYIEVENTYAELNKKLGVK